MAQGKKGTGRPRKKFAVWLFDQELIERLKGRAREADATVGGLVQHVLRTYLDGDHQPLVATPKTPEITAEHMQPLKKTFEAEHLQPVGMAHALAIKLCRYCKHARERHQPTAKTGQLRCAVMGCACARYMA